CVTHKVKIAPPDYSKENYLATFTPQKQLTPEQIFWSQDLIKIKEEALKKQTIASRPIKALMVYPPNTPATLVLRVLPIKKHFEGIQNALTKEMKDIFEELEAKVDQNVVNRKHDEIEQKNILIGNYNIIVDCLSKEVFYIATNSELTITRVKHIEHTTDLLTENENLKAQIHENLKCNTMESVKPRVLALGRYAIDVEPIPPHNRNNREVHLYYLKHLKESVETLREIVEEAKVERPLDRSIVFACRYTKHSQELLEYVIGTCPKAFNQRDKKHAPTPLIRKKQVTFDEQYDTSNSNTHKHVEELNTQKTNVPVPSSTGVNCCTNASRSQPKSNTKKNRISPAKGVNKKKVEEHPRINKSNLRTTNRVDSSSSSKRTVINSNSDSVCQTCNKCLISANHDVCVVDYLQSVKASPSIHNIHNVVRKVKQVWKPKQVRQVWKPTGKVLTSVGHQWRPTGRIFTLGEQCPLTRLTKPKVAPAKQNENQAITCANQQEPNQNWGSNFPNSPSFQTLHLRLFSNAGRTDLRFGNDHFGAIMGYGDYVIGDSVISRVYYVEGLGHNLFSVGQFCDSDLEVAFRKHSCYVRDTDGVELIKGSRGSNLYTISVEDIKKSSPIFLLSKASKNKSWLWHRRLNHLNFGTINDLARKDLVRGLPRLKFEKDHLCSACQLGKSKKHTHKPKTKNTNLEVLNTLHMDSCGPMRVQTINGKKYILVIVDDYSRFTWVKFFRSKDETPENDVVERQNRTLVEAARTMLIFSKAPMFLWAEVVATACYTQNRSLIHTLHNKTPYELVHDKKPDLTFLCVFRALCYHTNNSEDLGKLEPTADIGIFVGYAPSKKGTIQSCYFYIKWIECAKAYSNRKSSYYGIFLTRLYRYVMETYPHLDNGTYDIVERVMRPLALRQTRRPRSDRGKARRSVSSSSSHHQGTPSHQHDDDDDDVETSRASTPSPTTYLNSLHPLDYQNYHIPSSSEQTDETLFARQTTLLNQT
ncbi:retrovirus-related pol polyprotein from transposon TNT 1-94, partial [Tanacetum coccineum]